MKEAGIESMSASFTCGFPTQCVALLQRSTSQMAVPVYGAFLSFLNSQRTCSMREVLQTLKFTSLYLSEFKIC
jgi:hypothetical protein